MRRSKLLSVLITLLTSIDQGLMLSSVSASPTSYPQPKLRTSSPGSIAIPLKRSRKTKVIKRQDSPGNDGLYDGGLDYVSNPVSYILVYLSTAGQQPCHAVTSDENATLIFSHWSHFNF